MANKFTFETATQTGTRLRLALLGPAGSGKTYSSLAIGTGLGSRVALIDTEHGSARKYAKKFAFKTLALETFEPGTYVEAIEAAEEQGFDVIIVDSLSHAWMGKGGALEQVDRAKKRSGGNGFSAWGDVTPQHNALVEAMLRCRAHLIVTMRTKMEYVQERDERTGKTVVRKVGMAPVQRDGLEYEFDVVGDLSSDSDLVITKTRFSDIAGEVIAKPGAAFGAKLAAWLSDGVDEPTSTSTSTSTSNTSPLAIPPALAPFYDALTGTATVDAAAALWHAHLPALDASADDHRTAAKGALVKRVMQMGGGVATRDAAKNALKTRLDALAKAAAPKPAAPVEPVEAQAPATPAERQPDPAPAEAPLVDAALEAPVADEAPAAPHPALGPFYARIEEIELPGESVAVWMKHRHDLAPLPVADREAAWQALCKRTETVGRMKNAKVWLKKAIAEEDARNADGNGAGPSSGARTDAGAPEGLASTALESLLADLGTARDAATLAATWEAITAADYERATVAQRAQLDAARTAREKALRQPPPGGPKGTRTREASPPASAQGSGEQASANDAAPATMLHRVLDTDLAHLQIAGTWRATEAGWRDHLAAIVVRRHLMNCVASNGAALGPRFLTLAAARLVEVAEPDPTTGARLNIIGAMPLVESAALEASRDRARRAAERQAA
ncbi:MAG: ATP-binding protein [Deltaproteobacteria bacterium]|nr:ATP-binding protein [Myxococcales bacterium]MDP3217303.1 ATP-binding protein [Deltaproteobacteria bacterium]